MRDLRAIPAVLDLIVGKWREGIFSMGSLNRRSAAAFVEKFAQALNAIDTASSDKVVEIVRDCSFVYLFVIFVQNTVPKENLLKNLDTLLFIETYHVDLNVNTMTR